MTFELEPLSPSPRTLPPALSVRTVLGSVLTQVGWIFVAFSVIFVWVFDPGAGIAEFVRFSGGELATTAGVSTGSRGLNLRINEVQVYETSYSFDPGGGPHEGASYQTGDYAAEGESVVVEYRVSDPSVSRIQGMRASEAGLWVSFILVFPIVGLVLAMFGMRGGLKARQLMVNGQLALGKLVASEPTNTRVNGRLVHRLTFEFTPERGGTYQTVAKTHLTHQLQDDAEERLVYDPRNPAYATFLDALPCRPHINSRGDFEASGANDGPWALLNLAAPAVSILGYGFYLLL